MNLAKIMSHADHDVGYRWLGWEHHKGFLAWANKGEDGEAVVFQIGKQIDTEGIRSEAYCYDCRLVLANEDGKQEVLFEFQL